MNLLGEEFGDRALARALRGCAGKTAQEIVHEGFIEGTFEELQPSGDGGS